jgi:hypothetical protein
MRTGFWCGNLKARDFLGNLGADKKIILKGILNMYDGRRSIGCG